MDKRNLSMFHCGTCLTKQLPSLNRNCPEKSLYFTASFLLSKNIRVSLSGCMCERIEVLWLKAS